MVECADYVSGSADLEVLAYYAKHEVNLRTVARWINSKVTVATNFAGSRSRCALDKDVLALVMIICSLRSEVTIPLFRATAKPIMSCSRKA